MKKLLFVQLVAMLALFSCKTETSEKPPHAPLPNFSNVNLSSIFTKEQNKLTGNQDSILQTLDLYYKGIWEGSDLSGGLLVAKGDKILFEKYRGIAREDNQQAITKNTPLHVASVSKTITAMMVLKLADAGLLDLNQKLTSIFPRFPYPEVRVIDLLNQRSGLPKYEYFIEKINIDPTRMLTNQDVLKLLIQYRPELSRDTNTGFMYCNTNYALLALVVEKITKNRFPDAAKEMVFDPLKMKNTFVFQAKDSLTASHSFYYRGSKKFPMERLDLIYGDKNVYTTPRDLHQFSKALYADNFLKKEFKDMIFQPYSNEKPGVNNYGLGFRMKVYDNGEKLTFHNGWWHGSNAVFAHLLKSNVTIVAIGNKFSRRVYSALLLSGLFENLPLEKERLMKAVYPKQDTIGVNQDLETE